MVSDAIYRFERAKGSRAGCQNSVCKKDGVKIQKGELRMGSLVWIKEHQSWMWKHWGCVTPLQIKNIQDQVEGLDLDTDLDILDGWEELDEESQDKIRQAIRVGHVSDEDWKGATGLNRPGMKGINQRTPKKAVKSEDDDDGDELEASPSKTTAKKSKKKSKANSEVEGAGEPVAKSKKKTIKKRKAESDISDDEPVLKKKSRTKKSSKAVKHEAESEEVEDEYAPKATTKSQARRGSKAVKKEEALDDNMDEPVQGEPVPKKTKGKAKRTKAAKLEADTNVDTVPELAPRARRSVRARKEPEADSEDNGAPTPAPKAKKAKKAKTANRSKKQPKPEPDAEPEIDEDNAALQVKGEEEPDVEGEPEVKPKPGKGKKGKKGAAVKKKAAEADVEEPQPGRAQTMQAGILKQEDVDVTLESVPEPAVNPKVDPEINPKTEPEAEDESDLEPLAPAQLDGAFDVDIKPEARRSGKVKTEQFVDSTETADPVVSVLEKNEDERQDGIKAEAALEDDTEMTAVPATSTSGVASASNNEDSGSMRATRKPLRGGKRKVENDEYGGPMKAPKPRFQVSASRESYTSKPEGRKTNVKKLK